MALIAIWDIESNGLLKAKVEKGQITPPMNKVHCVAIIFSDGRKISAADQPIDETWATPGWTQMSIVDALRELEKADLRIAHNGQDFDERAIPRIYPWFKPKPGSSVLDTLLLSRLLFPDIRRFGFNNHRLMPNLRGSHSLGAWGKRLGEHKGDYKGGWTAWSPEMHHYMVQDVVVLEKLFKFLMSQKPSPRASALEHDFAAIIRRQEDRGFAFDMDRALILLAKLQTLEAKLEGDLIQTFGEWWESGKKANSNAGKYDFPEPEEDEDEDDPIEFNKRRALWLESLRWDGVVVPTKSRRVKLHGFPDVEHRRFSQKTGLELKSLWGAPTMDYEMGSAYTPIKRVQFNPSSRHHIFKMLVKKYAWEPAKFTKKGQPVIDDDIIRAMPYPEAPLLANYFLVTKRIGAISGGRKAWMKMVEEHTNPNGTVTYRIHGQMNTNGAATGRGTHSNPNLAQVAKNTAAVKEAPQHPELWGKECRALFIAAPPYRLVGADGSSLELCMLAHYTSKHDGGEYARIVASGRKEDASDPHSWLRDLVGTDLLGEGDRGRDHAKTTMYAFLYGAGDEKLGSIVLPHGTKAEKMKVGAEVKAKVFGRFTALAQLNAEIVQVVEEKHSLIGLDGRILKIRKAHAALNTLLQSAGAVVMKQALVCLDRNLQAAGLVSGRDYEFVANVHDEYQCEVLPEHVELYMKLAIESLPEAGKILRVQCPLRAEASQGKSWCETH